MSRNTTSHKSESSALACATSPLHSFGTPLAIVHQQRTEYRRELKRLNALARALLKAADGDPAKASNLLEDVLNLLEAGVLSTWRYRIVLIKILKGADQ